MNVMKQALLLLLLVAIGSNAAPEDCEGLTKRLPTKDLHKISGDWVLVWSVADHDRGHDLLTNVSSSHIELRLSADNKTIELTERNIYLSSNKSCTVYFMNMTVPSDSDAEHHTLHCNIIRMEKDGVDQPFNESGDVEFYESCDDCLLMTYKSSESERFLLSYKREGSHQNVDQLTAAHDDHKKKAECLGFPHHKPFSYDGAADFCHKKSAPEEA